MTQVQDLTTPLLLPLPHATRSVIYNALFSFLKQIPAPTGVQWKTFSQAIEHWDNVAPAAQPALFLTRQFESTTQKTANGISKLEFHCLVWIYFRSDGMKTANTYPDQYIDPLKDAIEQLFQTNPPNGGRLTLGGVCHHCWLNGGIYSENGLEDATGQAVVVFPVSIWV